MGRHGLAEELRGVAGSVRASIRALRTLLVDIYPPSLARAGLAVALPDLAQTVRAPGLNVVVEPVSDEQLGLHPDQERLVYRVAQETMRNAAKHATPCTVRVSLGREQDQVVLDVVDDGRGFDPEAVLADPDDGHFGLRLLADSPPPEGARCRWPRLPGTAPAGACVCARVTRPTRRTVRRTGNTMMGRVSDDPGAAGR